jgi:hypothetical protein
MTDVRQKTTIGNRFRFLVRGLGLVGFLSAVIGLVLTAAVYPPFEGWTRATFEPAVKGEAGPFNQVAVVMFLGGLALVLLALVVELIGMLPQVTGRRTVAGTATAAQTALAVAAFVLVNVVSFSVYRKFDCTRERLFTLPDTVVEKLKTIDPTKPTTVVVLQKRVTSAGLTKSADALDRAAERKIAEKVEDLVDQFREFGPQFKVTVLDVEDEAFEDKKDALLKAIETQPGESAAEGKRNAAVLRAAIDAAPEDSVLFYSEGKVQRLAFQEFYQLDRTASTTIVEATVDGKKAEREKFTNLVLLPQGTKVFANRLEQLDAKKPKVGLLVIHPLLATKGEVDEYSAAGLRKSLEANGFEVVDVITRKWTGREEPTPTINTYAEADLDDVEEDYLYYTGKLDRIATLRKNLLELAEKAATAPLTELDAMARRLFGRGLRSDDERDSFRKAMLALAEESTASIKQCEEQLAEITPNYLRLTADERTVEGRRKDMKAKLDAAVADCDLLIIPRLTVTDAGKSNWIPPNIYPLFNLVDKQAAAVKAFVQAGKPVMVCFGPTSIGEGLPVQPDEVEKIFNRFGVTFGNQTILSDRWRGGGVCRPGGGGGGGPGTAEVKVPPLAVVKPDTDGRQENPVSMAFETTARAAKGGKLEVKKSGFRPIYVKGPVVATLSYLGDVVQLGKESWNETKLIGDETYVPQLDPPKLKGEDPTRGTLDEERKGPFTVGVAVEAPVPVDWVNPRPGAAAAGAAVLAATTPGVPLGAAFAAAVDPSAYVSVIPESQRPKLPTVRLAAFGHGGLFTGNTLNPAVEKLLLLTANWQLKRDDRLPKPAAESKPWQFPRVNLDARDATLWWYGAAVLPPVFCGVFGVLVLMMRKVR